MDEKKLGETAETWKNALFLTALACFFFGIYGGTFHDGQYTWELINLAVIFNVASQYLPKMIDAFSKKEEEVDEL